MHCAFDWRRLWRRRLSSTMDGNKEMKSLLRYRTGPDDASAPPAVVPLEVSRREAFHGGKQISGASLNAIARHNETLRKRVTDIVQKSSEIVALRDETEEDAKEIEASKFDLAYIALDGTIGCMVNGAGLAMATLDIIQLYGESPANFLDVGGGASEEKVTAAFKIITSDPNVKGILVNIFGGIMKCDIIARGVLAAVKAVGLQVPLVVRLTGTNEELGKQIVRESGLNVIPADNLDDAAQKIVKAVRG